MAPWLMICQPQMITANVVLILICAMLGVKIEPTGIGTYVATYVPSGQQWCAMEHMGDQSQQAMMMKFSGHAVKIELWQICKEWLTSAFRISKACSTRISCSSSSDKPDIAWTTDEPASAASTPSACYHASNTIKYSCADVKRATSS